MTDFVEAAQNQMWPPAKELKPVRAGMNQLMNFDEPQTPKSEEGTKVAKNTGHFGAASQLGVESRNAFERKQVKRSWVDICGYHI